MMQSSTSPAATGAMYFGFNWKGVEKAKRPRRFSADVRLRFRCCAVVWLSPG